MKTASYKLLIILLFLLSFQAFSQEGIPTNRNSWSYQLNEMNYLVLKSSSINIIHGLHLTKAQAKELKSLAKQINKLNLPEFDTYGKTYPEFKNIRTTYVQLLEYLKKQEAIPDSLKDKFSRMRMLEADIVKKTIVGAQNNSYKMRNSCLKCHAPPNHFPSGNISEMQTNRISEKKRQEIDLAHVRGIFGEQGVKILWKKKDKVSKILTNGQKYMLKDFRCTFIPPEDLADPTNIGQAFEKNKWVNYLTEIRSLSDKNWKEYKQLYIIPIEDIIEATLPGIKRRYKKDIIADVEDIIEEARSMDKIDFELQKEMLCKKLKGAFNVDFLIGENNREKEERQFISAMFLLFPGSVDIYNQIIEKP
jgi:hypothetical protein